MVVTRDTAHFERSLLNADAYINAVQIIQKQDYNNRKNKETKNKNTKKKKKIGNNIIYQCEIVCQILKWKNYKEQYTNKKKETKELKLKWLRTVFHVGDAGHRPLRKITIER